MKKVLVICLGNICRSPTAEAVLRACAKKMQIDIEIDSAGTIDHHQGQQPDPRAMAAGQARGYSFAGITSRPVCAQDFEYFDLILAADNSNVRDLKALCPPHLQHKIALFLSYVQAQTDQIPDPYYGGDKGFELVLDLLEEAASGLLTGLSEEGSHDG